MKLLFKDSIKETGGEVAWLQSKGSKQILELNWYPKRFKHGGGSGLDHLAFQVRNADKTFKKLVRKYEGPIKPFDEGSWRLTFIKDPDRNWIELRHKLTQKG